MQAIAYALRKISQLLAVFAAGLFLFDIVREWISGARFKVRSVQEFWMGAAPASFDKWQAVAKARVSGRHWDMFLHLPAPLAIVALAALVYVTFRFLFYLGRGDNHSLL